MPERPRCSFNGISVVERTHLVSVATISEAVAYHPIDPAYRFLYQLLCGVNGRHDLYIFHGLPENSDNSPPTISTNL